VNKIKHIIILLMAFIAITSCNRDDDFDELFYGKTWYIVGAKINGTVLKSEVKQFYQGGINTYYINFSTGTLRGALSAGEVFSGTWSADPVSRDMVISLKESPSSSSNFDKNILHIISGCKRYKGDCNVMRLIQDDNNYIDMNYEKPE